MTEDAIEFSDDVASEKSRSKFIVKLVLLAVAASLMYFYLFVPVGAWECGRPLSRFEKFVQVLKAGGLGKAQEQSGDGSCYNG